MSSTNRHDSNTISPPAGDRTRGALWWALLLGFCMPLSGGLQLSTWIPGFPDQVTPIRVATAGAVAYLVVKAMRSPERRLTLPTPSRRLLQVVLVALAYATATLAWTPNLTHGIHDLLNLIAALTTGFALIFLVRSDQTVLARFAIGVLVAGALQVALAVVEVLTGFHASTQVSPEFLQAHNLERIEDIYGPIAFGTLSNPNDLGSFLLVALAIFLASGSFGLNLSRRARRIGWIVAVAAIVIGIICLNDARGFRFGALVLLGMYLIDHLLPEGPLWLRIPALLLLGGLALGVSLIPIDSVLALGPDFLGAPSAHAGPTPPPIEPTVGESDFLRFRLIATAFTTALAALGMGRGLGTSKYMVDSGQIPTDFHNVFAHLAAELGFVIALGFLLYLVILAVQWAFLTPIVRRVSLQAAFARAALVIPLVIWGFTSSGVLDSAPYWTILTLTVLMLIPWQHRATPASFAHELPEAPDSSDSDRTDA